MVAEVTVVMTTHPATQASGGHYQQLPREQLYGYKRLKELIWILRDRFIGSPTAPSWPDQDGGLVSASVSQVFQEPHDTA